MFIDNQTEQNQNIPNSTIFLNINDSIDFSPSKIDLMKDEQKCFTTNKIETFSNSYDKKTSNFLEEIPIYISKSNKSKSTNKIISIPINLNYGKKNENIKNLFQNNPIKEKIKNDYTRIVTTTEIKELSLSSADSSKSKNKNLDYNEITNSKMTNISYIYNLDIKNDIQNIIDEISLFAQMENIQTNINNINNNQKQSKNIDLKYKNKGNLVSIQELDDEEDENEEKYSKYNKKLTLSEKNKNNPIIFSSNFSEAFIHSKKFSYSPLFSTYNLNNFFDDVNNNNNEEKNDSFINNNIIIKPLDTFISYNNEITCDDINDNENSFFNESDMNKFFISPSKKDKKHYKDRIYHTLNKSSKCNSCLNINLNSSKKKLANNTYIKKTVRKINRHKNNELTRLISPENLNKHYTLNCNNNFDITDFNTFNKINQLKNFYKDDIMIKKINLFKNLNLCENKNNNINYIDNQRLKNIAKYNDKNTNSIEYFNNKNGKDNFFKEYNDFSYSPENILTDQSNFFLTTSINTNNSFNNVKENTNINKSFSSKQAEKKNCNNEKDSSKNISDFAIYEKNKNIKHKKNKNAKKIDIKNGLFFTEIPYRKKNGNNNNIKNNKILFEKLEKAIAKEKDIQKADNINTGKNIFNIKVEEKNNNNKLKENKQNNINDKKENILDDLETLNKIKHKKNTDLHIFSVESYEKYINELLNKTSENINKIKRETINSEKFLIQNKDIDKYIISFDNKLDLFRNYCLCLLVKKHYLPNKEEKRKLIKEFNIPLQKHYLFNNYISLIKVINENKNKLLYMIKIQEIIEKYLKIDENNIIQAKKIYKLEGELSPYSLEFKNNNERVFGKNCFEDNNINTNNLNIKKLITVSSIVIPMFYLIDFLYKYIK